MSNIFKFLCLYLFSKCMKNLVVQQTEHEDQNRLDLGMFQIWLFPVHIEMSSA